MQLTNVVFWRNLDLFKKVSLGPEADLRHSSGSRHNWSFEERQSTRRLSVYQRQIDQCLVHQDMGQFAKRGWSWQRDILLAF